MSRLRSIAIASLMVVAALALVACGEDDGDDGGGGQDGGTATIRFLQPIPESLYFYPLFVGEELGYFQEEGVKVELLPGSQNITSPAFVAQGDADVAATGTDEVPASIAQGAELSIVYDYYVQTGEALVVPTDSEIQDVTDLEGQTVGLAASDDRVVLELALSVGGADADSVETVTVGPGGPTVANAFETGRIDAYSGGISDVASLEATVIDLREITPREILDRPAASFIVSSPRIEENADALAGFMRAWAKATYVGIVNRPVVEAIAREAVPEEWENEAVGDAALDVAIERQTPEGDTFGELRPEVWQRSVDQLVDAGELEEPLDIEESFDDQFIEQANDWDRAAVEQDAEQYANQNP